MKLHPAVALALVLVSIGGGTFYLTQPQYENAFFCTDSILHVGTLQSNITLLEGNTSVHCGTGWQQLQAICGKFVKGKKYSLSFDKEYCDQNRCYPASCQVT